ncbi:hypothetical protein E5676_scaffold494G00090 [Cucumis melo var. makuwa]|uniref:Reverse transcriptase zinc-binding domain-containing protein n=1 Tax=Cucumis melo var. makuwa TaxID=1194695 RepID=A0A5D3DE60_CUCMM|nr:hypothetical protein E5676_scaffold494G00090 [Cucumis melo var. makuwa]
MRNFFREGHADSKINQLVNWNKVSSLPKDGGLGLGGIKIHNTALLAKWGWRYSKEESALWRQVIRSIHGKEAFDWFTKGKSGNSLRSHWVNIARFWRLVDSLASFNLGNGLRIGFRIDPWVGNTPIKEQFSRLFSIALWPRCYFLFFSWPLAFRRSLEDEEITEFQSLLFLLSTEKVVNSDDFRSWSIESHGRFSDKSLSTHLKTASPMDKRLFSAILQSGSPRRINILIWIMVFRFVNSSEILQKKSPINVSPSICPLCLKASKNLPHIFLYCPVSSFGWERIFSLFNLVWNFDSSLSASVIQLLSGSNLPKTPRIIWEILSKALLIEIWIERNQRIFHDKARQRAEIMHAADLNAAAWCSLRKEFVNYSIQDICLNWNVFLNQD